MLVRQPKALRRGPIAVTATGSFLCAIFLICASRSPAAGGGPSQDTGLSPAAAESPVLTTKMGTLDGSPSCAPNCGVNAAYFCLRWFSREAEMESLGQELNTGDLMEQPCSFADLRAVFSKNQLLAVGIKGDNLQDVLNSIKPSCVGVVRLSSVEGVEDVGHFVVVVPLKADIAIVDPPRKPVVVNMADAAKNQDLMRATGEVLVVSEGRHVALQNGPLMQSDADLIDIGRIPIGVCQLATRRSTAK